MKKLGLALAALIFMGFQSYAQEKSKTPAKGEMKVVIIEDDNGNKTTFDSTFSINDRKKVEEILKQRGIDFKMELSGEEIKVIGEGGHKVIIKEDINEQADENGFKKIMRIHAEGDEGMEEKEIEIIMESIGDELEVMTKQIQVDLKDGNLFEFKTDGNLSEEEIEKLKQDLGNEEGKFIMKTIVLDEDEDGQKESRIFSFSTDVMVFFISDEGKEELTDDLPTEIVEKDLKSLQIEELKLFPNPNNGHFNISFDSNQKNDFQISVSDVNGRTVYEKSLTNFKGKFNEDFDLSQHESGMYFFNIVSGDHKETKKILLK